MSQCLASTVPFSSLLFLILLRRLVDSLTNCRKDRLEGFASGVEYELKDFCVNISEIPWFTLYIVNRDIAVAIIVLGNALEIAVVRRTLRSSLVTPVLQNERLRIREV